MPEQHSLTPLLGMLQNQGRRVALVTDGRLSGASRKVPAAIHVTPQAARAGALASLREGDRVRLDREAGVLDALVDADEWPPREVAPQGRASARQGKRGSVCVDSGGRRTL